MRIFESGAMRNDDKGKYDIEGFTCPKCLDDFYAYMHKHRFLEDGSMRDGDNWQHGIPNRELLKSALRHVHDWRLEERGYPSREGLKDALMGIVFNAFGRNHNRHNEEIL